MKQKNPEPNSISVIIPTYNRLNLLREAVDSVLQQTMAPLEILIVDDGSTDGTLDWSWPQKVRVISIDHLGMPGRTRNAGILASTGRWLAFLDSDDLWHPKKLESQFDQANSRSEKIFHCREIWNRDGRVISQKSFRHQRNGDLFLDSLKKCIIGPSTVMIARELLEATGLFREDLELGEDYELWLRITKSFPVAYLDEPLVTKRAGHGDQLSEKHGQIEIFRIQALRGLVSHLKRGKRALEDRGTPPNQSKMTGIPYLDQDRRDLEMVRELKRKISIYSKGALKRGRLEEARTLQMEREELERLEENLLGE